MKASATATMRAIAVSMLLIFAAPLQAKSGYWLTVPDELRTESTPISAVVHLKQDSLLAGGDPSVTDKMDRGLVGSLLFDAFQSAAAGGARKAVDSAKVSVQPDKIDDLLIASIRKSLASVPWVKLREGAVLKDNSLTAKDVLLDNAEGRYLLDIDCSYNLSSRLQSVYAYCSLQIAAKDAAKGSEKRWYPVNLVYMHNVEAEISISNPAKDNEGRREQWLKNDAILLRENVARVVDTVGGLVGKQLLLSAIDLENAKTFPRQRLMTGYVGLSVDHAGPVFSGYENIQEIIKPNANTNVVIYKPGTDGMTLLQKPLLMAPYSNLYHNFSVSAP